MDTELLDEGTDVKKKKSLIINGLAQLRRAKEIKASGQSSDQNSQVEKTSSSCCQDALNIPRSQQLTRIQIIGFHPFF